MTRQRRCLCECTVLSRQDSARLTADRFYRFAVILCLVSTIDLGQNTVSVNYIYTRAYTIFPTFTCH
jgi:hypothetical protein